MLPFGWPVIHKTGST